jgi:hypothetical protein
LQHRGRLQKRTRTKAAALRGPGSGRLAHLLESRDDSGQLLNAPKHLAVRL